MHSFKLLFIIAIPSFKRTQPFSVESERSIGWWAAISTPVSSPELSSCHTLFTFPSWYQCQAQIHKHSSICPVSHVIMALQSQVGVSLRQTLLPAELANKQLAYFDALPFSPFFLGIVFMKKIPDDDWVFEHHFQVHQSPRMKVFALGLDENQKAERAADDMKDTKIPIDSVTSGVPLQSPAIVLAKAPKRRFNGFTCGSESLLFQLLQPCLFQSSPGSSAPAASFFSVLQSLKSPTIASVIKPSFVSSGRSSVRECSATNFCPNNKNSTEWHWRNSHRALISDPISYQISLFQGWSAATSPKWWPYQTENCWRHSISGRARQTVCPVRFLIFFRGVQWWRQSFFAIRQWGRELGLEL